jgi:hypothetical protein
MAPRRRYQASSITLDFSLLPLFPLNAVAGSARHLPTLMDDAAIKSDSYHRCECSVTPTIETSRAFDLLVALKADISRYLHRITNQRIPAHVVHSSLDRRFKGDDVYGQSRASSKRSKLVIGGFG